MEEEIWRDVVGYEGLYEVSNFGSVRSVDKRTKWRYFKGHILSVKRVDRDGYTIMKLFRNGKEKRIVLQSRVVSLSSANLQALQWMDLKEPSRYALPTALAPLPELCCPLNGEAVSPKPFDHVFVRPDGMRVPVFLSKVSRSGERGQS